MGQAKLKAVKKVELLKLDLGCGVNKREGFTGVDILKFDGVDKVCDLRKAPWPWATDSVDEVHSSHFVEHLQWPERIVFFNELYRVMKDGAKATIITPDPSHDCFFGDPTHGPPMSSWYTYYLDKEWREGVKDKDGKWVVLNGNERRPNAPHVAYTCDFIFQNGLGWDQSVMARNEEYKLFAALHYRNSVRDLYANLVARKK